MIHRPFIGIFGYFPHKRKNVATVHIQTTGLEMSSCRRFLAHKHLRFANCFVLSSFPHPLSHSRNNIELRSILIIIFKEFTYYCINLPSRKFSPNDGPPVANKWQQIFPPYGPHTCGCYGGKKHDQAIWT